MTRDNGLGVSGIAPRATIYGYDPVVVGNSTHANYADAMARNASVTMVSNNSWTYSVGGMGVVPEIWKMAVEAGVTTGNGGKGVSYIFGAGNDALFLLDYANLSEQANFWAITTVGGVDYRGKRAIYSEQGPNLWISAPTQALPEYTFGYVGILTTDTLTTGDKAPYQDDFSGTSASAPIISGVVALMIDANPDLTWRDVKLILAAAARKVDPLHPDWDEGALRYGSATERYHFNHDYGFGLVDAGASVDLAKTWTNVPALRKAVVRSPELDLEIPDFVAEDVPNSLSHTLTVDVDLSFIEYVQIHVDFNTEFYPDLDIELISPDGKISLLSPYVPEGIIDFYMPIWEGEFDYGSGKHLGENSAGEWTLRFTDFDSGDTGKLNSWGMTFYGQGNFPDAPEFPDTGAAVITGSDARVSWTAPENTGGVAITGYDLRHRNEGPAPGPEGGWTVVKSAGTPGNLNHTVTGLERGVIRYVQVRAVTSRGVGPWSEPLEVTRDLPLPQAPAVPSVTPGHQALAVSWSAPSGSLPGEISSYDIRYILTSADETADANWTLVTGAWTSGLLRYAIERELYPILTIGPEIVV